MKGTGIQTDPYLIETWDDFFDMSNDSIETYYMLMNDLDGNNWNGGIFGHTNIVHTNLDGNGHTIRNLYYTYNGNADSVALMQLHELGGTWKNLRIENVLTNISLFGGDNAAAVYFESCVISAECFSIARYIAAAFTECTISAKLQAALRKTFSNYDVITLVRCSVNCRIINPTYDWDAVSATDSRIEMQLEKAPSLNAYHSITVKNCVLAIEMLANATYSYKIKGDSALPSVLDSTLWGTTPTSGITDVILLPTEDMKNADALNAAGFTVARVS